MKKLVLLATAALVAMLILVPTALAQQDMTVIQESTVVGPLAPSGGPLAPSVLLPAAALLLGAGVVAYALVRRR